MYVMGSTFVTGRIHARHDAPAVLDLLADGTLDVALGIPFDPNALFLGEVSEVAPPIALPAARP
jgi:hypothetical protein